MRHAGAVALLVLLAAAASGLAAALLLKVRTGYVDLLDPDSALQARYLDLLDELGNVEPLHVFIESDDPMAAGQVADAIEEAARQLTDDAGAPRASLVVGRSDLQALRDRAPAWLTATALRRLAADPGLPELVARPSPDAVLGAVRARIAEAAESVAGGSGGSPAEGHGAAGPTAETLAALLSGLAAVARGDVEPTSAALMPASTTQVAGLDAAGRMTLGPGRLLVTVTPADTRNDADVLKHLVRGVREAADRAVAEAGGGVSVALTGAPALIVDEMGVVRRDIALASGMSFALVTLLFFVSFNSLRHVAFAVVANAAGLAMTFGAAWLLVGHLNLFSSVFAAVLAGLGIDFGIHFINFYEARRREGLSAEAAIVSSYALVVPPITVSAVTTAAAFLTITSSEFAGFSQLGLISGVGVLLCLLTAFTLLPALLAWSARRRPRRMVDPRPPWTLPLLMFPVRAWKPVALGGVVLVAVAGVAALRLRFDHDLMNLQPAGTEAVALQRDDARRVGTHPAFSLTSDPEEARARAAAFRALPSVAAAHSPADALPPADSGRPAALRDLARALQQAGSSAGEAASPVDVAAAASQAQALHDELVALQDLAFEGGQATDVTALDAPIVAAADLVAALRDPGAGQRLSRLQADLAATLRRMAGLLPELADHGLRLEHLPEALRALVGREGRFAIAVIPAEGIWERAALLRFLDDVRTVDPAITGPAVQVAEVTELMRLSLRRAAFLAFGVIAALVWLAMRRLDLTLLSLLPLTCGFILMLGLMHGLGVPLNPANLVALPLLLGIGVDGGLHLVHRWHATGDAARAIMDVGHALLITSLTAVAGFLPLLLARHQGIRSLGAAACLGSLGMLVAVVLLAPAFLCALDALRAARGRSRAVS